MKPFLTKTKAYIVGHKFISFIIALIIIIAGYYGYRAAFVKPAPPQYTLSVARMGTIMQTVSGTGQVSASNQLDVTSQVSGTVTGIDVTVGQHVSQGDLLATIDDQDALQSLQDAKLALAKLTEAPKATDLADDNSSIDQSYTDGYNAVSSIFLDLPPIMSGMNDLLYSQTGFLSNQRESVLGITARTYRDAAGAAYDLAVTQTSDTLQEFKGLTRSSATTSLDTLYTDAYTTINDVSQSIQDAQTAIDFISTSQPDYDKTGETSAAASVTGWGNQVNGDLSSLVSARSSITSNKNTLSTLVAGADPLDVQTQELAVQQAENTYDEYFIRAPFDGTVGRIPVNVYGQAGGSTVIATVIGDQKIAAISLNEVDAAKVSVGQPVMITFDAIDGLNATGTVSEVDQVGTVVSGVVSYGVKIAINTVDSRIKPGMSVNTTVITDQETNVLVVPTSAIKTQGKNQYVQVFDSPFGSTTPRTGGTAGGTSGGGYAGRNASSTSGFASTTGQGGQASGSNSGSNSGTARTRTGGSYAGAAGSLTISSATPPRQVIITTGISDDTNTQILTGLKAGQFVVTKTTTTGTTAAATAAPSILSSIGAGGRTGGAAAGGGAAAFRGGAAAGR